MNAKRFGRKQPRAVIIDKAANGVGLPSQFHPRLPELNGTSGVPIKSYILPDGKTGVVRSLFAETQFSSPLTLL